MNKYLLAAVGSIAAVALAPAANAAQFLEITGPSGVFGDGDVVGAAGSTFTRTFTFATPTGFNLSSLDISSIAVNPMTNIDFSSVTFNGIAFNILSTGTQEFRNLLNQAIVTGGTNSLVVNGTTGGNAAFGGNLSFAAVSAVPEPTTWAFMLVGFGAVGYSMRKRPAGKVSYKFAQAV